MEYSWILLSICLICISIVNGFPTEDNSVVHQLNYGEIEDFVATTSPVYHMESDLFTPGNILYSDLSSLKTTNGVSTSIVVGHASARAYGEGVGGSARFNYISGFIQLNTTHLIVVDRSNHCLRMVNRQTRRTSRFSGRCGSAGFTNGIASTARFYYPSKVIRDKTNNNSLIVSHYHQSNHEVLRAVSINTGAVTTAASVGFNAPRGMAWNNDGSTLYVTNWNYIAAVNWTSRQTVKLVGSVDSGNRNGNFSQALLNHPMELLHLKNSIYIFNDQSSKELKFLDIKTETIFPVCAGESCKLESYMYSMVSVNDTLFIGGTKNIRRLTGLACVAVEEVYIQPQETTASVIFDSHGNSGEFPAGEYQFNLASQLCSSYIMKVKKSPVIRRLTLTAEYNVTCSNLMLGNAFGRSLLEPILKHKMTDYQDICHTDCKMSTSRNASYTCEDDILKVMWPTDSDYPIDVREVPSGLRSILLERLQTVGKERSELVILNQRTQFVLPRVMSNGLSVDVVFENTCADVGKHYQPSVDQCL